MGRLTYFMRSELNLHCISKNQSSTRKSLNSYKSSSLCKCCLLCVCCRRVRCCVLVDVLCWQSAPCWPSSPSSCPVVPVRGGSAHWQDTCRWLQVSVRLTNLTSDQLLNTSPLKNHAELHYVTDPSQ